MTNPRAVIVRTKPEVIHNHVCLKDSNFSLTSTLFKQIIKKGGYSFVFKKGANSNAKFRI